MSLIDPLRELITLPTEAGSRNRSHTHTPWVIDFVKQPYTPHCLIADMQSVSAGTKSLSYHVCSWASPPENELPPGFAPQCSFSPSQNPAGWWVQIVAAASRSPHCWSQCLTQGGKIDLHDETDFFSLNGNYIVSTQHAKTPLGGVTPQLLSAQNRNFSAILKVTNVIHLSQRFE